MATRYNAKPRSTFGVPPLPTGFDNLTVPDGLTIPPVGIEDVDRALFDLFNKQMNLQVRTKGGVVAVPIIFASGEKWALLKKGKAIRDKTGSLILPLITIGRDSVSQSAGEDITGRGINQQTGELVIKRRLNPGDRRYQSLINKLYLKNQTNLAINPDEDQAVDGQLTTSRSVGELRDDPTVAAGGLLAGNNLNNVWEIITIPAPQFFTSTFEVTIWTSYIEQMNQILEGLIGSFLPQGNAWKLETDKGYWFVARVDGNLYQPENNFDDMASTERMIKYKFNIKVPGYILASKTPGAPVPIRSFVSNPEISFTLSEGGTAPGIDDPFLGADDPTLPNEEGNSRRADQRADGKTILYPGASRSSPYDPALAKLPRGTQPAQYREIKTVDRRGKPVTKYARIKGTNPATGETTYSSSFDLSDLSIIVVND